MTQEEWFDHPENKPRLLRELISQPIFQEALQILKDTSAINALTLVSPDSKTLQETGAILFANDLGRAKTLAQLESLATEPEENKHKLNPTYAQQY